MARWIAATTLILTGLPMAVAVMFATVVDAGCGVTAAGCQPRQAAAELDLGRPSGSTGPTTNTELATIGRTAGRDVPGYSILRDPAAVGNGSGGPSVNLLAPTMKLAVLRLELAMGARLHVVSGYRTAGYQAQLCPRVAGPCAPPGRSMHQADLAVDVTNWAQTLPYLSAVGLCQPLPATDAGHLSHVTGREC